MKLLKQKDNTYKAESHTKGKYYTIDPEKETCTCPHYKFRLAKVHGLCKHIQAVKDKSEKKDKDTYNNIINHIKENKEVDSLELIKKFGEEPIDNLLSRGDITEKQGKITLLN